MGFSAEWLSLREPADRAARDDALARRAAVAAGSTPVIVDLGCGTGATRRALAPYLPANTRWFLVDSDPALLAAAVADGDNHDNAVEAIRRDIGDLAFLPLEDVTLVTASALLDLVTAAWTETLARRLRAPFYAALSYCGDMRWTPDDPRDAAVTRFFNRHQQGDKGLGPALGSAAGERAAVIFANAGFDVQRASSPWQLGPESAELQHELIDGIASAAAEAGCAVALDWGRHRRSLASQSTCEIGHLDILAIPRERETTEPDLAG